MGGLGAAQERPGLLLPQLVGLPTKDKDCGMGMKYLTVTQGSVRPKNVGRLSGKRPPAVAIRLISKAITATTQPRKRAADERCFSVSYKEAFVTAEVYRLTISSGGMDAGSLTD